MLVGKHMSTPVITIHPDTTLPEALNLMQKEKVRRFPVVDDDGKLVGIVSENDLLHAAPSSATSLSIWEMNYLLNKIAVNELMTREVITVTEDVPLEEAALKMVEHSIGGLPVMRSGKLVGLITETDIFKVFLKVLGAGQKGIRLVVKVPHSPGQLALLSRAIFEKGGNMLALIAEPAEDGNSYEMTIRITGIPLMDVENTVKDYIDQVIDLRTT
jgi:acetoin utilization protein AcuB